MGKRSKQKKNMAVYGHISEFVLDQSTGSLAKESWVEYCERMDQYFVANDISSTSTAGKAKQKAIFISSVGAEVYSLLKTLCSPDEPTIKSLDELQKVIRDHLSPAPIVIAERFVFYNRRQHNNEKVAEFMKELRRLASTCEFHAAYRDDVLRDMFVIGLIDKDTQRKLLGKADLNLATAFQTAQAEERAKCQVEAMAAEVHHMSLFKSNDKVSNDNTDVQSKAKFSFYGA